MARFKEEERRRKLTSTRQALLAAAAEEIAREGYEGANINRISLAAGFAKGTIYNYFSSKHDLLLALVEEIASDHCQYIGQQILQENDPVVRLESFFKAGFAFVSTYPAKSQVMLQTIFGPDYKARMAAFQAYLPMFQLVGQEILAEGIGQGLFRPVDAGATAGLLMNIYLGAASQVNEQGVPWLDPNQVADFVKHALSSEKS
jgi:AcrR family transcriptional regulator